MAIRIGRQVVDTPLVTHRVVPAEHSGVAGPWTEEGYELQFHESGNDAQAALTQLLKEAARGARSAVHVEDDNDLVVKGYYKLEGMEYEKPGGAPKSRPGSVFIRRKLAPFVVLEAESHNILGTDTADVDASEESKVAYTPTTAEEGVLKLGSSLVLALRMDEAIVTLHSKGETDATSEAISTGGTYKRLAQKFTVGASDIFVQRVYFRMQTGSGATFIVRIETDSPGDPTGTVVGNLLKDGVAANVDTDTVVDFAKGSRLTAGTSYWLVLISETTTAATFRGTTSGTADQVKRYDGAAWSLSANVESLRFGVDGDLDGKLSDSSGFGNPVNSTIKDGCLIAQTGKVGNAMEFDGVDGRVTLTGPVLSAAAGMTYEVWVKPDTVSGTAGIIGRESQTLQLQRVGAEWHFAWNDPAIVTSDSVQGGVATAGSWHHVVCTHDGTTARIYVGGVLVASKAGLALGIAASTGLIIGCNNTETGSFFDGALDEVRVYRRALTAAEVKLRYDLTTGGVRPVADHRAPHDEALDLPEGTYRVRARVKSTVTTSQKYRASLVAQDGTVTDGSQVTVGAADGWEYVLLNATLAVSAANAGKNALLLKVQGVGGALNPVEVDLVEVTRV